MTQIESLTRRNLVLGVVAVLLLGYVLFRPSETSAVTTESLPELFPDLDAAQARTVILERTSGEGADAKDEAVRIQREDEIGWVLASAQGYPANPEKVNRFLEDLQGTRRKKFVTERAETFDEYAGPEGWTHVQVLGEGGKTVADFQLGKSAGWPDSFARVTEDGKDVVVRAYNLSATDVRLDAEAWTEARLWPGITLPDVQYVSVAEGYGDASLILGKKERAVEPKEGEGEDAGEQTETVWIMLEPEEAEVEQAAVDNLVRSFTGMRFSKIVGRWTRGEDEDLYGLTDPTRIVSVRGSSPEEQEGKDALGMLLVGKPVPAEGEDASSERVYVMRDADRWVFEVTAASVADFRKQPADFLPAADESEEPAAPAPGGDAHGSPDDGEAPDTPIPPGGGPPLPPDEVAPPDAPGPPETPQAPEVPETPGVPEKPDTPKGPDLPDDG